jgi:hypothetical protein
MFIPDNSRYWYIEVENNLSYPIYAIAILANHNLPLGLILPGETASCFATHVNENLPPEARREITKISVFSEDRVPLMVLEGKGIDEYVIYIERKENYNYFFHLEVKEEYIGMGLNKKVDFEEEINE